MKVNCSFKEAIRMALKDALSEDATVRVFGLGVTDPIGVFGTTSGLNEEFGPNRVFDIPLSENAVTGVALGMAMNGLRPIMNHQRADFAFTSMEQIVNQVAKLDYTTKGVLKARLVIRMIVGRGWGQGPTHAQSPHALYAAVPGLRVVAPATPEDAYWLLRQSIETDDPVIFIEHRWLHNITSEIDLQKPNYEITDSRTLSQGDDLLFISFSYGIVEALRAETILRNLGFNLTILNLRSLSPLDEGKIIDLARKIRRIVILDSSHSKFGISAEISAIIHENLEKRLERACLRIGNLYEPTPSAPLLAKNHYPQIREVVTRIVNHFQFKVDGEKLEKLISIEEGSSTFFDQPVIGSVGPF